MQFLHFILSLWFLDLYLSPAFMIWCFYKIIFHSLPLPAVIDGLLKIDGTRPIGKRSGTLVRIIKWLLQTLWMWWVWKQSGHCGCQQNLHYYIGKNIQEQKRIHFFFSWPFLLCLCVALPSSYVLVIYQAVLLRTTLFMAPLDGSHHPSKSLLLYEIMVTLEIIIFLRISSGTRTLYIIKWTDEKRTGLTCCYNNDNDEL